MLSRIVRIAGVAALFAVAQVSAVSGADQKEIDRAIKAGTDSLKARYNRAGGQGAPLVPGPNDHGIGPVCMTGLALLEAGTPVTDASVKTITDMVRDACYKQTKTYQVSLCLMYLDRLGDPADVPRIQMLAVRLLIGQDNTGGWGYDCILEVPAEDERRLRAMKADQPAGQLHPEVKEYGQALTRGKGAAPADLIISDNSNTQFAVLAVWMARKHGVLVDNALELVERRFMTTQDARSGNWPYLYQPPAAGGAPGPAAAGSPSMYCAGLLGLATGVARREERRLKTDPPPGTRPDTPPKETKPGDPFYNPPGGGKEPPKKDTGRPVTPQDRAIAFAFDGLGLTMAEQIRSGRGLLNAKGQHGYSDLYFLWSLERVGVIYGLDKIGGLDWYDLGSTVIVRSQSADGSWEVGGYSAEVNTAFAVLFLCRSNLARDLSNKVQRDPTNTEMRAGSGPTPGDGLPTRPTIPTTPPPLPVINLPNPTGDEGITLASTMLKASDTEWPKLLIAARDEKGTTNTRALMLAATHTVGDRKKQARDALAERLCRMTPATLRAMLKADEVELRRAAALACAMKDDKDHIPDLIEVLADPNDSVSLAAKAGLKSLTGKDFGPASGSSAGQKALAVTAWKEWYAQEKK